MSQTKTEIAVRHTASSVREVVQRVVRTKEINGVDAEVVNFNGREYRVHRKGRGIFIWRNRPLGSTRTPSAVAA